MHRMLAVLVVLATSAPAQNLVSNGNFERTKATGCQFNLSNPLFSELMPGCTGFGTTLGDGEIDIMQGGACGYGLPAASGSVKVGIAADNDGNGSDAFSFRLKSQLVAGLPYRLRFKANAYVSSFSPDLGAVEVGLSSSPTEFGVKVGELVPSPLAWSSFDGVIVPATSVRFLTVRYQETKDGWNHVDDFVLEAASSPALKVDADGAEIHVAGATPGSLVAILVSPAAWSADEPAGSPGVGTLASLVVADGTGGVTVEHAWPADALPLLLQAVDLSTRAVSPVVTLDACARVPAEIGSVDAHEGLGTSGPSPPTSH
jgi:hypothetical protein